MQTVKEDCRHEDCKYRQHVSFLGDSCPYMLVTGKRRGCEISECDKYEQGEIKTTSMMGGFKYDI